MSEEDNLSVTIETTINPEPTTSDPEPVRESPPVEEEQQKKDEVQVEVIKEIAKETTKEVENQAPSEKVQLTIEVDEKSPQNREVTPQLPPKSKNTSMSSLPVSPKSNATDSSKNQPKRVIASSTIESDPIRSTMKTFSQLQEESAKKKKRRR